MTINEYTENAVKKYLRTVLFVDDKIFPPDSSTATEHAGEEVVHIPLIPDTDNKGGATRQKANASPGQPEGSAKTETDTTDHQEGSEATQEVNPKEIVDGFAKYGIACSLYQPQESDFLLNSDSWPSDSTDDAAETSDGTSEAEDNVPPLIALCEHADVFILDWKLTNGSDGSDSPVPRIIHELINKSKKAGNPKPIRFCAIYTLQNKDTVLYDLKTKLVSLYPSLTIDGRVKKIVLEGMTIRIYGKPGTSGNQESVVTPSELAKEIIKDFTSEYEGIMSATALYGIATVRDNAKRILDKFPKEMDPELVLHAGLTIKEKNIVADITSLLGDEISSVLSDMDLNDDLIYNLCAEAISKCSFKLFEKNESDKSDKFNSIFSEKATSKSAKKYLQNIFIQKTYFPEISEEFLKKKYFKKDQFEPDQNVLQGFRKIVERQLMKRSKVIFGALSSLFCQRTIYSHKKILHFGTIVRKVFPDGNHTQEYFLCLMPSCDSIRLKDTDINERNETYPIPHKFPFWKLDLVLNEGEQRTHGFYVESCGKYLALCAKGKIRDKLHLFEFFSQQGSVIFNRNIISTVGSVKYEWIAELKPAHIQRIAEGVSREFSRVGLTESEWLRLLCW